MKRILFVNPIQYGYSAAHHYYCKYLKHRYRIDYICIDKGLKKLEEPGVDIIYFQNKHNRLIRAITFLLFVIKKSRINDYDFLYVVFFKFAFLFGLFCKARLKILDIRTCSLSDSVIASYLYNKFNLLSCVFFDRVTVISEELRDYLNLPKHKSFIVPLGAELIDATDKVFNRIHLIYVGTLYKRQIEKTIIGLAMFLKKYKSQMPIKYMIIGFGVNNEEEIIIRTIRELKLDNIVNYLGIKNHKEVIDYIKNSNIGICFIPKKPYYEKLPSTKLFEYGLAGLILLGTSTKQNRSYINEENGIICEDTPESFCESLRLIYDRLKTYESGEIRKFFMDYTWPNIVEKYVISLLNENKSNQRK